MQVPHIPISKITRAGAGHTQGLGGKSGHSTQGTQMMKAQAAYRRDHRGAKRPSGKRQKNANTVTQAIYDMTLVSGNRAGWASPSAAMVGSTGFDAVPNVNSISEKKRAGRSVCLRRKIMAATSV